MMSDYEIAYDSPVDYSDSEEDVLLFSPEDWQDWNSEELLNLWMSVVQYHEEWYLPLRRTFNEFCEFVYSGQVLGLGQVQGFTLVQEQALVQEPLVAEIQAIKDHPFIKGLDWNSFFSLRTK